MTVHWINKKTFEREKAVLACRELSVSQTHNVLAHNIMDIHQKFDIEHKVCKIQILRIVISHISFFIVSYMAMYNI